MLSLSCSKNNAQKEGKKTKILANNFTSGLEGWTGDFADYPMADESIYELEIEHSSLPTPLDGSQGAIKQSGNNHSDDLFMFIKKKVTGLTPKTKYNIFFDIEFASNAADGSVGVGGSPGESVYIKAGAAVVEPEKRPGEDGFYRMNIDIGNQANRGHNMIVLGDFSNDTHLNEYAIKKLANNIAFYVQTDASGSLWVVIGVDSGFESTTTIYYNRIGVRFD